MNATLAMMFLMVVLVDVLLAITPWLMPKTECFAVTVPAGARNQEPLRSLMRAYARWMGVCAALCLVAWPIVLGLGNLDLATERGIGLFAGLVSATMCIPVLVSFVLMLHYRKRVRQVKAERGWKAEGAQVAAFVGQEEFPKPISLAWNLAYIPVVAAMVTFALLNYDKFPDMVPMHIDFNGTVTNLVPKTLGTVMFPAMMAAFMGVVFTGAHWGILRSKKPIDPEAPASSALAYGRFARTTSIVMFVGGLGISVATGVLFFASSLGGVPMTAATIGMMVVAIGFVAAFMFVSVRLGQSGGRIAGDVSGEGGSIPRDDDAFWPLGIFYVNRNDPSIFVPKRFGVGWTLNLGNVGTWVVLALFVLVIVVFTLGVSSVAA